MPDVATVVVRTTERVVVTQETPERVVVTQQGLSDAAVRALLLSLLTDNTALGRLAGALAAIDALSQAEAEALSDVVGLATGRRIRQGAIAALQALGDGYVKNTGGTAGVVTEIPASDVTTTKLGAATHNTLQALHTLLRGAGHLTGGEITDAGSGTINVAAGTGLIRAADSPLSPLLPFVWPATNGIAVPADSMRYVVVEYNAGTPQVALYAAETYDYSTAFPIGVVARDNGTMHIDETPHSALRDPSQRRLHEVDGRVRANTLGGLILGQTGTRKITVSAGVTWTRGIRETVSAIDTSVAGHVDRYYSDGAGGWTVEATETQFPNDGYDDGSGTLASLTNSHYGAYWLYLCHAGEIAIVYGTSNANKTLTAQLEEPPSNLPPRLLGGSSLLLGRYIVQKSSASAAIVESAFTSSLVLGAAYSDADAVDAIQAAGLWQLLTGKNAANGYAGLDASSLLSVSHLGLSASGAFPYRTAAGAIGASLQGTVALGAYAVDWAAGDIFTKTLAGSDTFTHSNTEAKIAITIRVTNSGGYAVPSGIGTRNPGSAEWDTSWTTVDIYLRKVSGNLYYTLSGE